MGFEYDRMTTWPLTFDPYTLLGILCVQILLMGDTIIVYV